MSGEGQILREARLEKGLELAQVEEATKIRIRYLEALEEENYKILPGSTYIKGFLRTYAKYLGLDPNEIIELYKTSEVDEPVVKIDLVNTDKPRFKLKKPALIMLSGALSLAIVVGIASITSSARKNTASYTPSPNPTAPVEETLPNDSNDTTPLETPPPQNEEQNPTTPINNQEVVNHEEEGINAKIVFTDNCWVVVNVDDHQELRGTFPQGTTKELTAKEKIELVTVGNAGGISITVNGKPYPSLGQKHEVVNNVVITKNNVANAIGFNY